MGKHKVEGRRGNKFKHGIRRSYFPLKWLYPVILLLFSYSMAYAGVSECDHWWGWDTDCLKQKARSNLIVNRTLVTDDELKSYIEANRDEIVNTLRPLDHGNDVKDFLNGSLYDAQSAMDSILNEAVWNVIKTFIFSPLEEVLGNADTSGLPFVLDFVNTAQDMTSAKDTLSNMLKVLSVENHRQLLDIYRQDRDAGMTASAAWQRLR